VSADGGDLETDLAAGSSVPSHTAGLALSPKKRHRSIMIGLIGAVVVIAIVIVGIILFNKASAALSAGTGTATITWTSAPNNGDSAGNPPQSFSGNISGHPASGVSTFALPSTFNPLNGSTPADLHNVQFFHYKGTLG
jgi:hypothetical protein